MEKVSLYYWGEKAAAGVEVRVGLGELGGRGAAGRGRRPGRSSVLPCGQACSLLVDEVAAHPDDLERELSGPVRVDVLPCSPVALVHFRAYGRKCCRFVQLSEQEM